MTPEHCDSHLTRLLVCSILLSFAIAVPAHTWGASTSFLPSSLLEWHDDGGKGGSSLIDCHLTCVHTTTIVHVWYLFCSWYMYMYMYMYMYQVNRGIPGEYYMYNMCTMYGVHSLPPGMLEYFGNMYMYFHITHNAVAQQLTTCTGYDYYDIHIIITRCTYSTIQSCNVLNYTYIYMYTVCVHSVYTYMYMCIYVLYIVYVECMYYYYYIGSYNVCNVQHMHCACIYIQYLKWLTLSNALLLSAFPLLCSRSNKLLCLLNNDAFLLVTSYMYNYSELV